MVIKQIEATELNDLLALYKHLHATDDPWPDPAVLWGDRPQRSGHARLV